MTLRSFEAIVEALHRADVRYLVTGGLAVAAHGYLRFTKDIDIAIDLDRENVEKLFLALAELGYHRMVPVTAGEIADAETRARLIREKNMLVLNFHSDAHRATPIDVFVTEPFDFAEEYEMTGIPVRFLRRAKLIEIKRAGWTEARRERMRRWAALPLRDFVAAIEEMGQVAEQLRGGPAGRSQIVAERPGQDPAG